MQHDDEGPEWDARMAPVVGDMATVEPLSEPSTRAPVEGMITTGWPRLDAEGEDRMDPVCDTKYVPPLARPTSSAEEEITMFELTWSLKPSSHTLAPVVMFSA